MPGASERDSVVLVVFDAAGESVLKHDLYYGHVREVA